MKNFHLNHYEQAFGNWLMDNNIRYIEVDEQKRAAFGRNKIKSFDYFVYPPNQKILVAEVKGRTFHGKSFAGISGFESWVAADDVDSLAAWQQVFGKTHIAVFIFVYKVEKVDVDFDGCDVYEFNNTKYAFFCIKLTDYQKYIKLRSRRWQTVNLPADKFRKCAVQLQNLNL